MKINKAILFIAVFCASISVAWATPVDVTAYGAVGDNSTDNRIFIQNAINSAATTGGTVYFPPGLYNVSGTLHVPSNIRLQGTGSTVYNTQIRLAPTQTSLFEVENGASNIVFKDLTLVANSSPVWPRNTPAETALIRNEGTTGISLKAGWQGIGNVVIENVRTTQFTYGISATSSVPYYDASISNVKIRNYASDGNEYSLYANTTGAGGWDVQNMDVYPMYDKQNGIFLERSGQMRFLQLSCAGTGAGICAKLWGNGDTYFRQMHVEGPRLGFCVGSNCEPNGPAGNTGENASLLTIENSATDGEFHRATNLVSINNRFWLDFPQPPAPPPTPYKFFGTGANSSLTSCGNVWVSWSPSTHMTNTTVTIPSGAFPGLATAANGCLNSYLTSVPVFGTGYEADNERLNGEVNVAAWPYNAIPNDGIDDTPAFTAALADARATRGKRVFVPSGAFDIYSTLSLEQGETVLGESGSIVRLKTSGISLFKVVNGNGYPVQGITLRNLTLASDSTNGTMGIALENFSPSIAGGASDFQIQNVDFQGFEAGISVHPVGGNLSPNANPMYDSVSLKDADFSGNTTAIVLRSQNASNWNLENITIDIPNGAEGVRIDGIGHLSIRGLSCGSSGIGTSCVSVQRQSGLFIDGLNATNVTNALTVRWENGWTQFPFTLRNSNLLAGVYFQGRVYLNSVNNVYPAKLSAKSWSSKVVRFGAYQEGDVNNIAYGGQSDIFSCNDVFKDPSTLRTQTTWAYTGTLAKPVTYCY